MSESVYPNVSKKGRIHEKSYGAGKKRNEKDEVERARRFEKKLEANTRPDMEVESKDTVSQTAMLNGGKMSEESWDGDPEVEKQYIVQEQIYAHGKVCIVDDRVVICGSANINDRVRTLFCCCRSELTTNSTSPN